MADRGLFSPDFGNTKLNKAIKEWVDAEGNWKKTGGDNVETHEEILPINSSLTTCGCEKREGCTAVMWNWWNEKPGMATGAGCESD